VQHLARCEIPKITTKYLGASGGGVCSGMVPDLSAKAVDHGMARIPRVFTSGF
jgi:hypothetical protein